MPTHLLKHSEDTHIAEKILKEAAESRQSSSVKESLAIELVRAILKKPRVSPC
jgi:hypothetical protein